MSSQPPREDDPRPRPKGLDAALEAAFKAGAHFGAGYPAYEAIPPDEEERVFQYWRRRWNDSHGTVDPVPVVTGPHDLSDRWM